MDFQDYYKTLGVSADADDGQIRTAYRKMARKYHPDINPGTEDDFKKVNEAYEVLKDSDRRLAFDELRQRRDGGGAYQPPPDWAGGFDFSEQSLHGENTYSEFFETLFRGDQSRAAGRGGPAGADLHARLEIEIEDAYAGGTKALSLRVPVLGPEGRITLHDRRLEVHVPKGTVEGQHIRVAGQGDLSGTGGDLFLEVRFASHPVYRAEGRDLYVELPVAPWEAALGDRVVMPTPGGKVELRIPRDARTGQKLRLKGKGLPGSPAGNIYVTLRIVNPKATTKEAQEFFEEMARVMPFDPRSDMGGT